MIQDRLATAESSRLNKEEPQTGLGSFFSELLGRKSRMTMTPMMPPSVMRSSHK